MEPQIPEINKMFNVMNSYFKKAQNFMQGLLTCLIIYKYIKMIKQNQHCLFMKISSFTHNLTSILCFQPSDTSQPSSLLTHAVLEEFEPSTKRNTPGVVPWSPPQPNWNPWANCNIEEGPLVNVRYFCGISYQFKKYYVWCILIPVVRFIFELYR